MKPRVRSLLIAAAFLARVPPVGAVPPGTGFTYQGELAENGVPLTGTVDLRFSLWDAPGGGIPPVGGTQLGASQLLAGVPVNAGVFTVVLNDSAQFGASAFNGEERWIQLEACDNASCTSATSLGPRQRATVVPYALNALGPWEVSGANLAYGAGNVGIGAAAPASRLHVTAAYSGDGIRLEGGAGADPAYHLVDGALDRASLALATAPGLW
ncbi:hypothetical protein K8I85_03535, partial [bacterium]|nr:hypothetical protein [bacterium]